MILAVIGVALAAAIVTFLVLLVVRPPKRQVVTPPPTTPSATSSTTTTLPSGPAIDAAALQRLTDQLVPFVERARRLTFTQPPRPILDDDAAYDEAFAANLDRTAPVLRHLTEPFKVLGLNPNDLDLVQAQKDFFGTKTVTFYDATANELHVRAVPATPYLSAMLVSKLTEELDDQHFGLERMNEATGLGDSVIGLRMLTTGDGLRIAYQWLKGQPFDVQNAVASEARSRAGTAPDPLKVPPALADWLILPSDLGVTFTQGLVTMTTAAPLDAAFRNPPDGAAQAQSIGRYQAGIAQLPVALPKADGAATAQGTFGQLFVDAVLDSVVPDDERKLAMNGYSGDALVAWKSGSGSCVRLDISTGDTDPAKMLSVFSEWAKKRDGKATLQPDAKRPGSKVVRLDVCDSNSDSGGTGSTTTTTAPAGGGGGQQGPTTTASPY